MDSFLDSGFSEYLRSAVSPFISVDCVFKDQDRVADFPGFADSIEDRRVLLHSRRISVLNGAVCEVLGECC